MSTSRISLVLLALAFVGIYIGSQSTSSAYQDEGVHIATKMNAGKPVEAALHEFMEYYNQPVYERLKATLSKPSLGKDDWKSLTSDSLLLAEVGNLLLLRPKGDDNESWSGLSTRVRNSGTFLYQTAQEKASKSEVQAAFQKVLNDCNACHQKYADGQPNLTL